MNGPPLHLAGTPYEIGLSHGRAKRELIGAFLLDDLAGINRFRARPLMPEDVLSVVDGYLRVLEREAPHLFEEVSGLAEGAGVPLHMAILLQYRRELTSRGTGAECTTLGWHRSPSRSLIAQNIDLNGNMAPLLEVFRITPSRASGGQILMVSFAGLLGFVGMNAAGLAVGINFVNSDGWRFGLSPYLLVRHVLEFETADDAVAEIARLPRASSRSLMLLDRIKLLTVEWTPETLRILEGDNQYHTNHYLHPDLREHDTMNVFSKRASELRLDTARFLAADSTFRIDPEGLMTLLSDHSHYPVGLCAHAEGHRWREETVGAVVLDPFNGNLTLRRGHPCTSQSETYSLSPRVLHSPLDSPWH